MVSWEKPLVKPMAPRSLYYYCISFIYIASCLLFCNLYFPIYTTEIPKIFILLSLFDLTFASDREGIDNPLSRWLQGSWLFVQVLGDLCVVSYWIDTLVLKNWGKYLRYFAASPFPLQGKTSTCSRGSIPQLLDRLFGNFWIRNTYQFISSLTHSTLSKDSTIFLLSMNSTNKYIWILHY